jgi:hypothetical protein
MKARDPGTIGLALVWIAALTACAAPPPLPAPPAAPPSAPDLPPAESSSRRLALAMSVEDAPKAEAELQGFLQGNGGLITARDAPVLTGGGPRSILLAVTIDARQADVVLAQIRTLGTVDGERAQADDTIPAMIELNAKLAGLRDVETRLRDWMDGPQRDCAGFAGAVDKRAGVVDEIALLVARQRLQGQRTQNTTLALRLSERAPPVPPPATFGGDVRRASARILADPCGASRDGAVTLVAWLPAIVLVALVLGLIVRRRRRGPAPHR